MSIDLTEPDASPTPLELGPGFISEPAYAPDGSKLIYAVRDSTGKKTLAIANAEGGASLSLPVDEPSRPVFTKDGHHVLFAATPRAISEPGVQEPAIYEIADDGSGFRRVSEESPTGEYKEDPTPLPGETILILRGDSEIVSFGFGHNTQRSNGWWEEITINGGAPPKRLPKVPGQAPPTDLTAGQLGPGLGFKQVCPQSPGVCGTWTAANTSLAAKYAAKYYRNGNTRFPNFQDDCTNYVSQLLFAGGMQMLRAYEHGKDSWFITEEIQALFSGKGLLHSESWTLAEKLYHQLLNTKVARPLNAGERPHAGDVVFFHWSPRDKGKPNEINHVGMIVAGNNYFPDSEMFTSHTNNRLWSMTSEYKAIGQYMHELDPHIAVTDNARGVHWYWWILRPVHLSAYVRP